MLKVYSRIVNEMTVLYEWAALLYEWAAF